MQAEMLLLTDGNEKCCASKLSKTLNTCEYRVCFVKLAIAQTARPLLGRTGSVRRTLARTYHRGTLPAALVFRLVRHLVDFFP